MSIETYSRLGDGPTDAAEQLVLQRVVSILERRGEDAVILVNLFHGRHEIDLVVATQTATLVMEVKGYRQAVEGGINSLYWRTVATGERRSNAYAKIDSAHMDLKDALRAMTGADPGYAHAVVLLAYGGPTRPNLPEPDHRVTITGIEALEGLLSTPVRPGTLRRLWSLDCVRQFAHMKGLALMTTGATACSVATGEVSYTDVSRRFDGPGIAPGATPQVMHRPAPPLVRDVTPIRRPRKRTWLRAAILSFIGLPILVGAVSSVLHHLSDVPPKLASTPRRAHAQSRRHAVTKATRRGRIERATEEKRSESSSALLEAQQANLQVQSASSSQAAPPAQPSPCPAGIDRLGCVPDPQTLAKLRNR